MIYTLNNTGPLNERSRHACPKKGVIGKGQKACVDYKPSIAARWRPLLAPSSSTSTPAGAASSATNAGSGTRTTPSNSRASSGCLCLRGRPRGQLRLTRWLTQLRQRHPDDAQQLQGLARLFGKPVCVRIIVLTCDPGSHGEQESALVRDVG